MFGVAKSKGQPLSSKDQKLHLERLALFAKIEHAFGKIFYDFFYSAVNIVLYNRELYSKNMFSVQFHPSFEMEVPFMRFPETIAYLEKMITKAIAIFSAGYLEALSFEEIDSTGNLWQYSFNLTGGLEYDPIVCGLFEKLKIRHRENLSELLMKVKTVFETSSVHTTSCVGQKIGRRWRLLIILKNDAPDDLLDDDPDATSFPMKLYSSGKKMFLSQESFYDIATDSEEITEDFEDAPIFSQENVLDFEKEGMSIIEYDEDQRDEDRGSPDLFESSQSSQSHPSTPIAASNQLQSPPVSYVLDPNELLSSPMARAAVSDDPANCSSDDTPSSTGLASPVLKDVTSGFTDTDLNLYDLLESILDEDEEDAPVCSPSSSAVETPEIMDPPGTPSRKDYLEPKLHVIATKVISETLMCNVFILHRKYPPPRMLSVHRPMDSGKNQKLTHKNIGNFVIRGSSTTKKSE